LHWERCRCGVTAFFALGDTTISTLGASDSTAFFALGAAGSGAFFAAAGDGGVLPSSSQQQQ